MCFNVRRWKYFNVRIILHNSLLCIWHFLMVSNLYTNKYSFSVILPFQAPHKRSSRCTLCLFPTGSQGLIHSSFIFSLPPKLLFWYLFMAIWSIFRSFFFSYSFFSDLLNNKSHTKNQCDKRMKRRRVLICFMILLPLIVLWESFPFSP